MGLSVGAGGIRGGCMCGAGFLLFTTIPLMIVAISTNYWNSTDQAAPVALNNEGLWKRCFKEDGCHDWSDPTVSGIIDSTDGFTVTFSEGTPSKVIAVRAWTIIYLVPAAVAVAVSCLSMSIAATVASVCTMFAVISAIIFVAVWASYKTNDANFGISSSFENFISPPNPPFGYDYSYWLAVSTLVLSSVALGMFLCACISPSEAAEPKDDEEKRKGGDDDEAKRVDEEAPAVKEVSKEDPEVATPPVPEA
jgi:hypothetical protein